MTASPPPRRAFGLDSGPKPAIELAKVAKSYKVYERPIHLLKEALLGRPYHRDKSVLSDISISIPHGQIVGVIGSNGAGKSTLLKIIAGTLAPTQGTVSVDGRVSAILELGTGFNPNYSGRDNVILSALMRGMSEQAVRAKFDNIVEFAGLRDVIDEPFHTYSSGMQARLAFAAAVSVDADILIIDEALAAGDARFTARSLRRIREICASGVTALFVSHQTYTVMQLCGRAIWIENGRIRMDGTPVDVVRAYEYEMHQAIARDQGRMVDTGADAGDPPMSTSSNTESAAEPGRLSASSQANVAVRTQPAAAPEAQFAPEPSVDSSEDIAPVGAPETAAPTEHSCAAAPESGAQAIIPPEQLHQVADHPPSPIARFDAAHRFSTGAYRIADVVFMDKTGQRTTAYRVGETLRLRVSYECLLPELPHYSCGLAVAFNRVGDFEAVMYFNTNYPHSDDELNRYFDVAYRKFIGRSGALEATIDPLQLRAGEYYVSLGILPNQPGMHEFYEYMHCHFRVQILANGFDEPAVFYPIVSWTNAPPS
jgi:ABC-type polysaccharide/polyol phosphate transport system ATPase subunit